MDITHKICLQVKNNKKTEAIIKHNLSKMLQFFKISFCALQAGKFFDAAFASDRPNSQKKIFAAVNNALVGCHLLMKRME